MEPLSQRTFLDAARSEVEFICDSSNSVTASLISGPPRPEIAPASLHPDLLKAYAGDYWSDELRVAYRLEVLNGAIGHPSSFWKVDPPAPTDPDRFDTNEGGWSIAFTRTQQPR